MPEKPTEAPAPLRDVIGILDDPETVLDELAVSTALQKASPSWPTDPADQAELLDSSSTGSMSAERAWGSNRRVDWVALRIGSAFGRGYPASLRRSPVLEMTCPRRSFQPCSGASRRSEILHDPMVIQ